jgi:hypothetical protein
MQSDCRHSCPARRHCGMVQELIPAVDAAFRTIQSNAGRALQGMSTGGQGCGVIGFEYPDLWSSIYSFAPAIDDNYSNVLSNEPALVAAMYSNNTTLFQSVTAWALVVSNVNNIIARALPIHITVGSLDPRCTTTGCSPSSIPGFSGMPTWLCEPDMNALMTDQGITHDALQVVSGCVHDFNCLLAGVSYANYTYAAGYFP